LFLFSHKLDIPLGRPIKVGFPKMWVAVNANTLHRHTMVTPAAGVWYLPTLAAVTAPVVDFVPRATAEMGHFEVGVGRHHAGDVVLDMADTTMSKLLVFFSGAVSRYGSKGLMTVAS
jgi:hypothetical protein